MWLDDSVLNITTTDLINFAWQVSKGMAYLAEIKVKVSKEKVYLGEINVKVSKDGGADNSTQGCGKFLPGLWKIPPRPGLGVHSGFRKIPPRVLEKCSDTTRI